MQPVPCNGARDLRVDHARLDDGNSVLNINLEHAAHPRKLYADPAADGERAARQSRPRAARNHCHALAREQSQHLRDLFGRDGEDDCARAVAVLRQPIALEDEKLFGV